MASITWTKMDAAGDRFARTSRRWAKITKRSDGRYYVACGWAGEFKADPNRCVPNVPVFSLAKGHAEIWLLDR